MGGKHKKCKFIDGCLLIASFGYKDGTGTKFCSKHKENNMVNLLCKLCDCGKSRPTYNFEGLFANFCKDCKTDQKRKYIERKKKEKETKNIVVEEENIENIET